MGEPQVQGWAWCVVMGERGGTPYVSLTVTRAGYDEIYLLVYITRVNLIYIYSLLTLRLKKDLYHTDLNANTPIYPRVIAYRLLPLLSSVTPGWEKWSQTILLSAWCLKAA